MKKIRTRRGVSQEILEELIGAPDKTIGRMERSEEDIPEYYEKLIRQALRMPQITGYTGIRTSSGARF